MGSSRVNCEIIEAKDEPPSTKQKPPLLKKKHTTYLERDINKLFESVNLRASKSLDLTDWPRSASKKPIRSVGSQSPMGIGFSDPVSLKQALRGMCISQAAEMAAVKRLSMPASPRISETGKPVNLYGPQAESNSRASEILPRCYEDSFFKKEVIQSSCSSLGYAVKPSLECISGEAGNSQSECNGHVARDDVTCFKEPEAISASVIMKGGKKLSLVLNDATKSASEADNSFENFTSNPDKKIKGTNKARRKSKLQNLPSSSPSKSNKDVKPTKTSPRVKSKNLVVKKAKKVAIKTTHEEEEKEEEEEENSNKPDQNPPQLICQKCQCSMENTSQDSVKSPPAATTANTNTTSKSTEISQSSKSSICDFSSSTTSLSEDSTLNGLSCSSRPHMSKDSKWGAIKLVRKKYGFLGLSHFNLLRKLGSGDIGTVYLAGLIGTGCVFAIKVMDNEFLANRKKMVRAQTESEILRMLDHPFLPALYSQFTSDNLSCLVMEFCPGGDLHVLRQKQASRYFSEQAARFYVAEVLLALEYLHMLGIIYRDLKPENILVREDGHIMLTDFDLSLRCTVNPTLVKSSPTTAIEPPRVSGPCAGSNCIDPFCSGPSCQVSCFTPRILPASARARKLKAEATARAQSLLQLVAEPNDARSNSFVGTHEYLAPEIIKGDGHGSAVDWWTFGVLLYELLYGKTPFRGACNEETLANVVLQNLTFPDCPIVSFHARDLIRRLLVKEPENRLGAEMGAAEIKRHPFFEGLNWALIRCGIPPQIPDFFDTGILRVRSEEKGTGFVECSGDGEHLEFELF